MNKAFVNLIARILISCIAIFVLSAACVWQAPTNSIIKTPGQISDPTAIPPHTDTLTPPAVTQPSSLVFPYITGDAGNFALLAGETITFTWENAPTGAEKYEFTLAPLNKEPSFVLGIDSDASDGVSITWTIPEHVSAELRATAYFPDGQKIETLSSAIYSGDFPPTGVCSLLARNQPVEVYRQPDRTSEVFALLKPAVYAPVLETAPNGWYRIDASVAELYTRSIGALPATGYRDVAVSVGKNDDPAPASGEGWVNSDKGVLLTGPCLP